VRHALAQPLEMPPLHALVRPGATVTIAFDDPLRAPATVRAVLPALLETLAGTVPSRAKAIGPALTGLRHSALADTTLVVVTAPPLATELGVMSRVGTGFGRRLALFAYPAPLGSMPIEVAAELEGRATVARATLQRAGWDVYVVHAYGKLAETWQFKRKTKLQVTGTPS